MENHLDKSQKGVMFFVCTHHTYWGTAACPQCQEEKNQQFCSLLGKIVMKAPTKEQLNDPQWWDENADPYATHYCPESRSFGFVSSAARECCYARPFNKEIPGSGRGELRKGTKLYTYQISNEMLETTDVWQYFSNGEWYVGSNLNNHKQNTIDGGYLVRNLCVSPTTKKETDMHEDLEFPSEKVNTSMLYLGQGHVEPESYTSNAEEEEAWQGQL